MSEYDSLYIREDKFVTFHEDDPDLPLIQIALPSVQEFYGLEWEEAIKKIDGYGLSPKDQHFENYRKLGFYQLPAKLRDLESVVRIALKKKPSENVYPQELFDHLEENPLEYDDEIKWIRKQQGRLDNGVFVFIKGKPTYLNGIHYAYLMSWPVDNEHRPDRLPFYRDIDRRIFHGYWWAYTTKSAFFKYSLTYADKNGEIHVKYYNSKVEAVAWGVSNNVTYYIDDFNDFVELPYRTVYGVVRPKRRRDGSTTLGSFFGTMLTLRRPLGRMAIQALTEDNARDDVFQGKITQKWPHLWFFFKSGHEKPQSELLAFTATSKPLPGDVAQHGGSIVPRSSKNKAFDGLHITFYLNDESGKKTSGNILFEWSDTIKNTLCYGPRVRGFALYTSTAGEFTKGGGAQYLQLCDQSFADERDDNGHTQTGLVLLMIPAYDGQDEFIDIYGESVIEDRPEPYTNLEGEIKTQGAKSFLSNRRKNYEYKKNWSALNNEKRSNPFFYRELREKVSINDNFNIDQLRDRVSDVRYSTESKARRVDLIWPDGRSLRDRPFNIDHKPVIKESLTGRFVISQNPPDIDHPVVYDSRMESWVPHPSLYYKRFMGIDPFKYDADDVSGKKGLSKGAGVIKRLYDESIDNGRTFDELETNRYILTYLHRPDSTDEFAEDMLKAAVLYGAMTNVERNVGDVMKLWKQWGFGGMLVRLWNPATDKQENAHGTYTTQDTHHSALGLLRNHFNKNVKREWHVDLMEQVMNIDSIKDVTKNDLVAAAEMCEYGIDRTKEISDYQKSGEKPKLFIRLYD